MGGAGELYPCRCHSQTLLLHTTLFKHKFSRALTEAASQNVIPASVVEQTQHAMACLSSRHLHKINSRINTKGEVSREGDEAAMCWHVHKMLQLVIQLNFRVLFFWVTVFLVHSPQVKIEFRRFSVVCYKCVVVIHIWM